MDDVHVSQSEEQSGSICAERFSREPLVTQVPVLVALPELATVAGQRAQEKASLRGQAERLKMLKWRRFAVGVGRNVAVASSLALLTLGTFWGLSRQDPFSSTTGDDRQAIDQSVEHTGELRAPLQLASPEDWRMVPDHPSEARLLELKTHSASLDRSSVPEGRVRLGQVIVQPAGPVLTARRPEGSSRDSLTNEKDPGTTPR